MSSHELHEVTEKAHAPYERQVGASMAIIAAVLAMVSVGAQVNSKEELLARRKASG